MRTLGNVIWLFPCGLITALVWFLLGAVWCLTLVGIPVGLKCFKLATLAIWPFGVTVESNFEEHPVGNALWLCFGGLFFAAFEWIIGIVLCCTLIGIPFAKQCFKLARFSLAPFGATVD
ncbi:MAG: hypothetical protein IKC32_01340 [Clostridia bacterium]|nr:hypothetical protein [Clostridia bacterium]